MLRDVWLKRCGEGGFEGEAGGVGDAGFDKEHIEQWLRERRKNG